eukprot:3232706-Pyramimonas_sp.AAC.1
MGGPEGPKGLQEGAHRRPQAVRSTLACGGARARRVLPCPSRGERAQAQALALGGGGNRRRRGRGCLQG